MAWQKNWEKATHRAGPLGNPNPGFFHVSASSSFCHRHWQGASSHILASLLISFRHSDFAEAGHLLPTCQKQSSALAPQLKISLEMARSFW